MERSASAARQFLSLDGDERGRPQMQSEALERASPGERVDWQNWRQPDRRWGAATVAGVLLVAAAIALDKAARRPDERATIRRLNSAVLPPPDAPPPSVLPSQADSLGLSGLGSSPLEELAALYREYEDDPAVVDFTQEFSKQPELKKAFDDFKRDQEGPNPKQTLKDLVDTLHEKASFRRLVARFYESPTASPTLKTLTREPALKPFVDRLLARAREDKSRRAVVSGARTARASGGADGRKAAYWAGASGAGAAGASLPGASGDPRHATAEATSTGRGAGMASAEAGSAGAGSGGDPSARGQATGGGPDETPGSSAHEVDPHLGTIGPTGPDVAFSDFKSLCLKGEGITRAQCDAINEHLGPLALFPACFKADGNLYDLCVTLCLAKPQLRCPQPPPGYYETCREAGVAKPECARGCRDRPDCSDCFCKKTIRRARVTPDAPKVDVPEERFLCKDGGVSEEIPEVRCGPIPGFEKTPPSTPMGDPGDPAEGGPSTPAQCDAVKPLHPKEDCFWVEKYGRCWCYEQKPDDWWKPKTRTEKQCKKLHGKPAKDGTGEMICKWNEEIERCTCYDDEVHRKRKCEKRKGCTWLMRWNRCIDKAGNSCSEPK